jgi:haloalkane dehalogenase
MLDDPERLKCDAGWDVPGSFAQPVLALWGDHCPHTHTERGQQFRVGIPGAQLHGIEHKVFRASHFIQEDLGNEMAAEIVAFIDQFPR